MCIACKIFLFSKTCLNRISLLPTFVSGIDRCLVYTGNFVFKNPSLGLYLEFASYRILFYSRFGLDRLHCTLVSTVEPLIQFFIFPQSTSGSSGFFTPKNWPPRYSWNIVESDIKHHKPNHPSIKFNYAHIIPLCLFI